MMNFLNGLTAERLVELLGEPGSVNIVPQIKIALLLKAATDAPLVVRLLKGELEHPNRGPHAKELISKISEKYASPETPSVINSLIEALTDPERRPRIKKLLLEISKTNAALVRKFLEEAPAHPKRTPHVEKLLSKIPDVRELEKSI